MKSGQAPKLRIRGSLKRGEPVTDDHFFLAFNASHEPIEFTLLPDSAAATPSMDPCPYSSGCLERRLAADEFLRFGAAPAPFGAGGMVTSSGEASATSVLTWSRLLARSTSF